MKTVVQTALRSISVAACLLLGAAGLKAQPSLLVYDFTLTMAPADNIDYVRSLGFYGLVTRLKDPPDLLKLQAYARKAATLDDFELLAYVAYDFTSPASADLWRQALPILASTGAPLWVVVKKAPSALALRQLLAQMARESEAFGIPTVLYPHFDTSIATAAEAAALIDEIGHPNLRNSIHTCHEIRGGNQDDLEAVVSDYAAGTALVAIAGADEDAYAGPPLPFLGWDDVIKPLDEGDYSLLPFLQALHDAGYDGPVILQTFGITNNPGHLERSLRAYGEYANQLVRNPRSGHGAAEAVGGVDSGASRTAPAPAARGSAGCAAQCASEGAASTASDAA